MTKILFAIAIASGTLASAPVLADETYYGTPNHTPVAREQDNADAGLSSPRVRNRTEAATPFPEVSRVYGFATTTTPVDRSQRAASAQYFGTSGRQQDNADAGMR